MIIERLGSTVVIKRNLDSAYYVMIGITMIGFYDDQGEAMETRSIDRPHNDYTIGDCIALLEHLEWRITF